MTVEDPPAAIVRRLRLQAGSHDKLAEKLGTSRQRVIAWERGAKPRKYAQKLAELSGLPAERFLQDPGRFTSSLPMQEAFLLMLREAELTPELRAVTERVADEMERSAEESLRVARGLRDRLAAQGNG